MGMGLGVEDVQRSLRKERLLLFRHGSEENGECTFWMRWWFLYLRNWKEGQGCKLSSCLFKLYDNYITWNARLDEAQAEIKIAETNISNLRYADDTTLMAESEEQLKALWMKVKEKSQITGLKLNIQKMKIMASGPITSWQIDGETMKQWQALFSLAEMEKQV